MKPNMSQIMKQAQKMQEEMQKAQENLENITVEATSGGGMVKVEANCKFKILSISIEPEVYNEDDKEMLEDLVIADPKEKIISLVRKDIPRLYSEVEIGKIVDHPGWEESNALPVVDREDVFLGALFYSVVKKSRKEKTKGIH